jgi:hypothetical protein
MNFKPILFSTPMVQAILDGRKTQTRRVIKPQPLDVVTYAVQRVWYPEVIKCSYEVGDVLWVRETFQITDFLHPTDENYGYIYKASSNGTEWETNSKDWKWKPSIFMPKEACRLFLQVKNIRVELLQEITEEDAIAEGIKPSEDFAGLYFLYGSTKNYGRITRTDYVDPIKSFHSLWLSINGPTSWVKNPWVWVIEFEKIEKPENFI